MPSHGKVTIGLISRVRGIKGEMVVTPLTDDPKRFSKLKKVKLFLSEEYRTFSIESSSRFRNAVIIKLAGIDNPEDAKKLVGCYLEIEKEEVPPLPEGKYRIFDIVGLKVRTPEGENLGEVKEVIQYPANDVYVISRQGKEFDLPATKEIIKEIDLEKRVMVVQPLAGIFD
jgi:16S rRNA processing protein RimM